MEAKINFIANDFAEKEFHDFIMEGLQDIRNGNIRDFDEVFDDLEKRFHINE